MNPMMNYGRGMAAPYAAPVLGRVLAGVGLLAIVAKVLGGGRRRAIRRAMWRNAFERYANQPLPIDQPGFGAGGPVHRVAVS